MRIGAYQFPGSGNLKRNTEIICHAIRDAAARGVRLLVLQECALCGYPPVETASIADIDFLRVEESMQTIADVARSCKIYVAVGTIRRENNACYNSLCLIAPNGETLGYYDKKALWGWDLDNFRRGKKPGVFTIDGIRVGFRICFDVRFPECFRELYRDRVSLCFVSFCDVTEKEQPDRYDVLKAHLCTRAVENVMTVVSVNSISNCQTAPTAIFDQNGSLLLEAPKDVPYLLVYDYVVPEMSFGMLGRVTNSDYFLMGESSDDLSD